MQSKMAMKNLKANYTIIVLGKTGSGKSALLNKLVNNKVFEEGEHLKSTTSKVESKVLQLIDKKNTPCLVIDTPGFYDSEKRASSIWVDLVTFLKAIKDGFNRIVYVINIKEEKFDASIQTVLLCLKELFGEGLDSKIDFFISHSDEFNDKSKQRHLNRFKEELPAHLKKFGFYLYAEDLVVYDYEDKNSAILKEYIENKLLPSKKYVFQAIKNLSEIDFDLNDSIAVIKKFCEKSKEIENLKFKLDDLLQKTKDLIEENENLRNKPAKIEYRDKIEYRNKCILI